MENLSKVQRSPEFLITIDRLQSTSKYLSNERNARNFQKYSFSSLVSPFQEWEKCVVFPKIKRTSKSTSISSFPPNSKIQSATNTANSISYPYSSSLCYYFHLANLHNARSTEIQRGRNNRVKLTNGWFRIHGKHHEYSLEVDAGCGGLRIACWRRDVWESRPVRRANEKGPRDRARKIHFPGYCVYIGLSSKYPTSLS